MFGKGRDMETMAHSDFKIILKRHFRGKNKSIFDFSSVPQIINGRPLKKHCRCVFQLVCCLNKQAHQGDPFDQTVNHKINKVRT